jgi:hypothetical protein
VPDARGEMLVVGALGTPFLGLANLAAVTIPSLLYPDTRDPTQNYLCGLFSFLLTLVASGPTVVAAVVMLVVFKTSAYAVLAAACVINILIAVAAIAAGGAVFRRFDPTSN